MTGPRGVLDVLTIFLVAITAVYGVLWLGLSTTSWGFQSITERLHNTKGKVLIDLFVFAVILGFVLGTVTRWLQ